MILHQNPTFSSIDPTPFHPFTNSPQSRNMPALASTSGFFLFSLFFILFFLANAITCNEASILPQVNGTEEEAPLVPLMEAGKFDAMMFNESRRKLGSFRICALCTCCGGAKGLCLASPCCYAINCNIPNRPFGFCSFTPKTCNCFGCHL